MAFEKRWPAVPPQLFIADGTTQGVVTVQNATLFHVKQHVVLSANSLPQLELEVKAVLDWNTLLVGPIRGNIKARIDVSAYTVAAEAAVFAVEQNRSTVPEQEIERHTYEEEPAVARRVILVDKLGNTINATADGIVPQEFDDVVLTRDITTTDVTQATYYLDGQLLWSINVTRDLNDDVVEVKKVRPL